MEGISKHNIQNRAKKIAFCDLNSAYFLNKRLGVCYKFGSFKEALIQKTMTKRQVREIKIVIVNGQVENNWIDAYFLPLNKKCIFSGLVLRVNV